MVWIKKNISEPQLFELKDHRDNTAKDLIKVYTPSQISFMDWISQDTVKTSKKYLPVRVDSWPALYRYKTWENSKPYRVMYIRLDEIKFIYNKRTWNKLVVELK